MTLGEARAKLKDAKWTREVPLVTLFDEVLEMAKQKHKVMVEAAKRAAHDPPKQNGLAHVLTPYSSATSTGLVVALVLGLRVELANGA